MASGNGNQGLTVAQLARAAETTVHAVRHYTRRGLLQPARDPANGYRRYRPRDAKRIRFIRRTQRLGFSLKEIAEILQDADSGRSPCPRVRRILERRVAQNRQVLNELVALQTRMERALERWQHLPDGVPDGDQVCHLIESEDEQAIAPS